jgi:GAF domain-containing protein
MTLSREDVQRALAELGRLRFSAGDVEETLHDIVRTTHSIFHVDGAALMFTDAQAHLRAAAVSDERIAHLEDLQLAHAEGPCLDAFDDHAVVGSEDLLEEERWPTFAPAAVSSGLRAVLASPIPFQQQPIGVVVVVSAARRPWTPQGELALIAFTDLAALLVAASLHAEQQSELAAGLRRVLDDQQVVEHAAASLAQREGVSPRAGHQRLKAMARVQRRALPDVAAEVLGRLPSQD